MLVSPGLMEGGSAEQRMPGSGGLPGIGSGIILCARAAAKDGDAAATIAKKRVTCALMAGRKVDFERNVPIFLSAIKRMCKLARDVPNWEQLSTKTRTKINGIEGRSRRPVDDQN
jgi:hypothetical protein